MNAETYLRHLRADVERIGDVLTSAPLDTPVPACPGWDLARLAAHLGGVQRWVTEAVTTGRRPSDRPTPPADGGELVAWFLSGADELLETLSAAEPQAPTWHPFGGEQVVAAWFRRQAHEHAIHRWDAQAATGTPAPIDAELASDGIDEYLDLALERLQTRDGISLPDGSVHLHCTDVAGEWLVWTDGDGLHLRREHAKGDAAVRGPAEAILLALWTRDSPRRAELDLVGDSAMAEAWLALPGL